MDKSMNLFNEYCKKFKLYVLLVFLYPGDHSTDLWFTHYLYFYIFILYFYIYISDLLNIYSLWFMSVS